MMIWAKTPSALTLMGSRMLTRRLFITGALALVAQPSLALDQSSAKALITRLVDQINVVIDSGQSETGMYLEFEKIFKKFADTSFIAAYAMGADGRRATASQKQSFSNAFTGYLSRRYGARFREFIGGRLEVKNVTKHKRFYEVSTTAYLRGEAPFTVSFHVSDRTGKDLFFNMYIEGVNMLLSERTEIGAMLDRRRGNIDAMIADLHKAG